MLRDYHPEAGGQWAWWACLPKCADPAQGEPSLPAEERDQPLSHWKPFLVNVCALRVLQPHPISGTSLQAAEAQSHCLPQWGL